MREFEVTFSMSLNAVVQARRRVGHGSWDSDWDGACGVCKARSRGAARPVGAGRRASSRWSAAFYVLGFRPLTKRLERRCAARSAQRQRDVCRQPRADARSCPDVAGEVRAPAGAARAVAQEHPAAAGTAAVHQGHHAALAAGEPARSFSYKPGVPRAASWSASCRSSSCSRATSSTSSRSCATPRRCRG